jgi:small membrane protein
MTLQPSQILLLAAILGFLGYAIWLRTAMADRLIYLTLVCGGVLLILFPSLATHLANLVGIGRGADLVFYLFVVGSLFLSAHLLARLHHAEQSITRLVRRLAIEQALREQSAAALPGRASAGFPEAGGDDPGDL